MPVTDRDLEAWASRIRPHFELGLQDMAKAVASVLVLYVGPRIKDLRPETRMEDVFSWLKADARASSLDWVAILMAVEEEAASEATDAFAETLDRRTFGEYVEHLHANRRGV